jgi:hypothetical protein
MLINKILFKNVLKSTITVLFISLLGAYGGHLFGLSFFGIFYILLCIQYVLFYSISKVINSFFIEKTKQKQLEKLENLSTILNCAYCNKENIMTFSPDDNSRVEFTCNHCDKKNMVTIQFLVARITESINIPKVTGVQLEDI